MVQFPIVLQTSRYNSLWLRNIHRKNIATTCTIYMQCPIGLEFVLWPEHDYTYSLIQSFIQIDHLYSALKNYSVTHLCFKSRSNPELQAYVKRYFDLAKTFATACGTSFDIFLFCCYPSPPLQLPATLLSYCRLRSFENVGVISPAADVIPPPVNSVIIPVSAARHGDHP